MRPSTNIHGNVFYLLDTEDAFTVGVGNRYQIKDQEIAVFRVGDAYRAFGNRCPHQGTSLCKGRIKEEQQVECPAHGWTFDVASGKRDLDPSITIPVYETLVKDGCVWVCVET